MLLLRLSALEYEHMGIYNLLKWDDILVGDIEFNLFEVSFDMELLYNFGEIFCGDFTLVEIEHDTQWTDDFSFG